ncbi:MAG TPA: hypothetical protein VF940_04905 [Streptosporangiaceae bacterium]
MIRLSRTILAASGAAAAIAAAAGCSSQHNMPSSPAALPAPHSPTPHRTHTPSVTPTPTTRTRTPGTPSTSSATQTGTVCVTSAPMGHCPFGRYPGITGASTNPYVDQNVWGPIPGWHQTLHATDPGHWYVTANMPAGNTAVVSFPNTGFFYNKTLSRFSSIVSSFTDSIPGRAGTNAEASYDIWFNHTGAIHEVMIQNDYSPGRGPSCGTWTAKSVKFGGGNGVPVHPWDLCVSGSTAYWETANGNMPSGTVNVLSMLKWLVRHGKLPAGVQLAGFSYGFEISSTAGVYENFKVSRFTAAAS